jgi:hypothetical protein
MAAGGAKRSLARETGKNQRARPGLQQAHMSNAFQKRHFATISGAIAGKPNHQ